MTSIETPQGGPNGISRRRFLVGTAAAGAALAVGGSGALVARARSEKTIVRVSDDGFPVHAEPLVAVNPRNSSNLLAAAQAWKGKVQTLATYASLDGGRSWRNNGPLLLPIGTNWTSDVTVAFDSAGKGFVCGTAVSGSGPSERGVYVWATTDGGRTFAPAIPVMVGQPEDHPWLTASRNVYAVWCADDLKSLGFGRSTDGGASFQPPRIIAAPTGFNVLQTMVAAGQSGLLGAVYHAKAGLSAGSEADQAPVTGSDGALQTDLGVDAKQPPPGPPGPNPELVTQVHVVCSRDAGGTFDKPVSLGRAAAEIVVPGVKANLPSGPAIAAGRRDSMLYVAFVTHEAGAARSDIVLHVSPDGGRSWRPPTPITPPGREVVYFQPQLAVDDLGRVGVSAFALGPNGVDVVLLISGLLGTGFGSPVTVTTRPFDPAHGSTRGKHGAWWIGDYQGCRRRHVFPSTVERHSYRKP